MKDRTKQIIATCLPIVGLGIWAPQLLSKSADSSSFYDSALGQPDMPENDQAGSGSGADGGQIVSYSSDVLSMGAAETLEQVDRLQQVLAGAELFRSPSAERQTSMVEALEAAVRSVAQDTQVQLAAAGMTQASARETMLAPVATLPLAIRAELSPEMKLKAWGATRFVDGILMDSAAGRCLLGGRVFSVGDSLGALLDSDTPLIVSAIEADAVVIGYGELSTRLSLRAHKQ